MRSTTPVTTELTFTDGDAPVATVEPTSAPSRIERFPYRVYYYVDAGDLFVIALLRGRRQPGLYRGR